MTLVDHERASKRTLAGAVAALALSLSAGAHATPHPDPEVRDWSAPAAPGAVGPVAAPAHLDDPKLRGVALADLASPLADRVRAVLAEGNPAGLDPIMSMALVESRPDAMIVDLVGRAPRFVRKGVVDGSDRKRPLGVVRVSVPLARDAARELVPSGSAAVVWERALSDMHPTLDVSLGDEAAVLEDLGLGFRRVWPIGIGAVDTIRRPGRLASLTPTTDGGRLAKGKSLARLGGWGRGLPYLPMMLPMFWHDRRGETHRSFYETRVAFHAWPGQGFIRGYVSRGCVVLRDDELAELFAVVQALPDDLAFAVHAAPLADAWHPWPAATDVFWRLQDFGKPGHPEYRVAGNLYVIEKLATAPPDPRGLVDLYSDNESRQVVALSTARGCGPVPVPLRMSDGDRCVAERGLIGP